MRDLQPDFSTLAAALFKRGITSPIRGYAPGNYGGGRCTECGEGMDGVDKRASCCLPCAVVGAMRDTAETIAEAEKRGRRIGRQSVIDDLKELESVRNSG